MTPGFGLVTTSAAVSQAQCAAMAEALAIQWARDLAPAWSVPAVQFQAFGSSLEVTAGWVCALFTDTVATPDDLAYHDELNGEPSIVIQVPVYGAGCGVLVPNTGEVDCISIGVSHEILETACDPQINLAMPFPAGGTIALEIADPVQDNSYVIGTLSGPVYVSDFVTPYWFDRRLTAGLKFDQMGLCTAPFQIVNGYAVETSAAGTSTEVFGDRACVSKLRTKSARRRSRLYGR